MPRGMKRVASLFWALFFGSLAACSAATTTSNSDLGRENGAPKDPGSSGDLAGGSEGAAAPGAGSGGASSGSGTIQAGTLTAGVWDDNRNFNFFTDFRSKVSVQTGLPQFTDAEQAAAHDLSLTAPGAKQKLDIQL